MRSSNCGEVRLSGIGMLAFAVLVLVPLFWLLRPDEHPLAMQQNIPLCDLLPPEAWATVAPADVTVTPHTPEASGQVRGVCEARVAGAPLGSAGSKIRPLARVMVTTEADLRYRNLGNSMGRYINTFVSEMEASGWQRNEIKGPWRRTYSFTNSTGETALLIDDEGVFVWVSSTEMPQEKLLAFAEAVTARLREAPASESS